MARPRGPVEDLLGILRRIDGRGYKAYKDIAGSWEDDDYVLHVDHVQSDPFADPSRIRVALAPADAGLPDWALATPGRRTSTADLLNRRLHTACERGSRRSGSGKSGLLRILRPGQAVLERTSLVVGADGAVTARFQVGLPASGRRVLGRAAADLLGEALPAAVEASLLYAAFSREDADALRRHVEAVEDAQALRGQLDARGLIAFVARGAVLPRASGVEDRPLARGAVPFAPPPERTITLEAPNAGPVEGLGVPRGVTLIVGGGFHGKSTLLRALEQGVYDHVPGDGREQVVTGPGAVKVRAEDGRAVTGTDIRNFVGTLPGGQDTAAFTTRDASGSTSQAAAIVEALEVGATCLLMDEDTSATNLMLRDARMQALVPDDLEPLTPFIDRVRVLADEQAVSTVLVVGGSGDYLDVADCVIALQAFVPRDVTAAARAVAEAQPSQRRATRRPWLGAAPPVPLPRSIRPGKGRKERNLKTPTDDRLLFGTEEVRLAAVEQLVEVAQARAIGEALAFAVEAGLIDGERDRARVAAAVLERIARDGLQAIQRRLAGDLAAFRIHEFAAVLGRLRTLEVGPGPPLGAGARPAARS